MTADPREQWKHIVDTTPVDVLGAADIKKFLEAERRYLEQHDWRGQTLKIIDLPYEDPAYRAGSEALDTLERNAREAAAAEAGGDYKGYGLLLEFAAVMQHHINRDFSVPGAFQAAMTLYEKAHPSGAFSGGMVYTLRHQLAERCFWGRELYKGVSHPFGDGPVRFRQLPASSEGGKGFGGPA